MTGNGIDPRWFKQAQRGLYAGKNRLSGNHVSPSKRHVRRHWLPNVQRVSLWSDVLQKSINMNATSAALKQMDRIGGLDEYLLKTRDLQSQLGDSLRSQIIKRLNFQEKKERATQIRAIRQRYNAASEEEKVKIEAVLREQMLGQRPGSGTEQALDATVPAGASSQNGGAEQQMR